MLWHVIRYKCHDGMRVAAVTCLRLQLDAPLKFFVGREAVFDDLNQVKHHQPFDDISVWRSCLNDDLFKGSGRCACEFYCIFIERGDLTQFRRNIIKSLLIYPWEAKITTNVTSVVYSTTENGKIASQTQTFSSGTQKTWSKSGCHKVSNAVKS